MNTLNNFFQADVSDDFCNSQYQAETPNENRVAVLAFYPDEVEELTLTQGTGKVRTTFVV